LLIIVSVLVTVLGLLGGGAYGAYLVYLSAEAKVSELVESNPEEPSVVQELKDQLLEQIEESVKAPEPDNEPVAAGPAVRFEPFESLKESDGRWVLYGYLVNDSPFSVSAPYVEVAFEKDGETLDTQRIASPVRILNAQEKRAVVLSAQTRDSVTSFSVLSAAGSLSDTQQPFEDLEVTLDRKKMRRGSAPLSGRIKNTGTAIAYSVSIDVVAFRDKGRTQPIGVTRIQLGEPLSPGETRRFLTGPLTLRKRAQKLTGIGHGYLRPLPDAP
ncbi:MAG: hypothetical protein AAFQ82_15955, partial [Myxococcota bacterium]